jgi:hypothetical protein
MVNVQKMHADMERSGENDRRRLESQMQMLESQAYVPVALPVLTKADAVLQSRSEDPTITGA